MNIKSIFATNLFLNLEKLFGYSNSDNLNVVIQPTFNFFIL